jgi:hypothetical protein
VILSFAQSNACSNTSEGSVTNNAMIKEEEVQLNIQVK